MDEGSPGAAVAAASRILPFEFRGTGGEYFRIWIVNLLLTIATLGIYSAWAKVRRLRYLYGSTSVAGSTFEYHGLPMQILKGRLIAVAVLVVYTLVTRQWPLTMFVLLPIFLVLLPLVIVLSRRFQMRMTSWRNIRFGFHGSYRGALAAYIGWGAVAAFTLYLLLPLWIYKRARYGVDHTAFGTERLRMATRVGRYFAVFYIVLGFGSGALLVLAAVPLASRLASDGSGAGAAILSAFLVVAVVLLPLAIGAYWERSFTNALFDGVRIGPHRLHCRIRVPRLLWLYVSNVVGILLTLGLFYPWALIRRLRYQFECMQVEVAGSLDDFAAASAPDASATGEAVGEIFDLGFGF